jgi:FKBP-type peptidyl-prolyl cis-trans isomerase FkpA
MKSLFRKSVLIQIGIVIILQGCLESPDAYDFLGQLGRDTQTIDTYLTNNGISTIKDVSGIRMDIHVLGNGLTALNKNAVTVAYTGKILGETVPFETGTTNLEVNRYIAGWQYALTTLPVGSVATVYIPSPLGYGNAPQDKIPANSNLVFDLDFQQIYISDTEKNQFKTDTTAINAYLETKNITNFIKDPTGIRYVKTTEVINGFVPDLYSKVKTKLTFKLLSDDTKTVATLERAPNTTYNGRVVDNIRAVTAVLQKMKAGEKATVYAPSYLAFNTDSITDTGNAVIIPANSVVIIEVELLELL